MKISVYGVGYVGLVQGAILADAGHEVICVDVDGKKIADLKDGIIPIYEPGLSDIVHRNYSDGRLSFSTNAKAGVDHGELQFIAVGSCITVKLTKHSLVFIHCRVQFEQLEKLPVIDQSPILRTFISHSTFIA